MDDASTVSPSLEGIDFEWHSLKAETNVVKHGITFHEAAVAFVDEFARIIDDPDHSDEEERFVHFGVTPLQGLLAVVYVERKAVVRLISARTATRTERRFYDREARVGV